MRILATCESHAARRLPGRSSVFVTSADRLQDTVDIVAEYQKFRKECLILASGLVSEISFDINAKVDKLKILREGRDELIVDGASTFGCTRIDEWQNTEHKQELWIDYKVRIRVGSFGTGSVWNIPAETWTEQNRENAMYAYAGIMVGQMERPCCLHHGLSSWYK